MSDMKVVGNRVEVFESQEQHSRRFLIAIVGGQRYNEYQTKQAIADGKYDWKNSDITTKNFPVSPEMIGKKSDISAKLFYFNRDISSDDAISEMDKAGYRPATLMELLVLGFLFPELQRQFPIVALGSVWRNANVNRYVPCLSAGNSRRGLNLGWLDSNWDACCRFLGVRK